MISMDSLTPKSEVKTPNSLLKDRSRLRRSSWMSFSWITHFCPTSGMSTQVSQNLLWVPYKDQKSKLGDIWLHTGPPSAPELNRQRMYWGSLYVILSNPPTMLKGLTATVKFTFGMHPIHKLLALTTTVVVIIAINTSMSITSRYRAKWEHKCQSYLYNAQSK